MKIFSTPEEYKGKNPVVTIGMFDGLHLGHKALVQQVVEKAKSLDGDAVILTFWPHPRKVLGKDHRSLKFISTLDEKTKMMSKLGIDHLILLSFTKEMAQLTAKEFVSKILVKQINAQHLVMGFNHRFGSDRLNDFESYQSIAEEYQIGISKVNAVTISDKNVSSSFVRDSINLGNIEFANKILGYRFFIHGTIVGGKQLGRKLGFPTANVVPNESYKIIPKTGVYACYVHVIGKTYRGMLNIGLRPTVNETPEKPTIEVHLFDFNSDVYSEEIRIEFVAKTRDEQKFPNLEALIFQLKKDEQKIRDLLD